MSQFCITENLDELKDVLKHGNLFDKSHFKQQQFLAVLEILWNVAKNKDKRCKKCFSKKTYKDVKRHRRILKYLFSKKKTLDKRKIKFLDSNDQFKSFVKRAVKEFFKNATKERKTDTENKE